MVYPLILATKWLQDIKEYASLCQPALGQDRDHLRHCGEDLCHMDHGFRTTQEPSQPWSRPGPKCRENREGTAAVLTWFEEACPNIQSCTQPGLPLLGDLLVCLGLGGGVGTDGSVGLLVHTLDAVLMFLELMEMFKKFMMIIFLYHTFMKCGAELQSVRSLHGHSAISLQTEIKIRWTKSLDMRDITFQK